MISAKDKHSFDFDSTKPARLPGGIHAWDSFPTSRGSAEVADKKGDIG